jgi:hypothetical protein
MSVTFQDLSYDSCPRKYKLFSVEKKVVSQIHTCEFGCPNCPFCCKLCFWLEKWFQKKQVGGKGNVKKKEKEEGKKKGHNYLDDAIMRGYLPPLTLIM